MKNTCAASENLTQFFDSKAILILYPTEQFHRKYIYQEALQKLWQLLVFKSFLSGFLL